MDQLHHKYERKTILVVMLTAITRIIEISVPSLCNFVK